MTTAAQSGRVNSGADRAIGVEACELTRRSVGRWFLGPTHTHTQRERDSWWATDGRVYAGPQLRLAMQSDSQSRPVGSRLVMENELSIRVDTVVESKL